MPAFRVGKPRLGVVKTNNQASVFGGLTVEWDAVEFAEGVTWNAGAPTELPVGRTGLWLCVVTCWCSWIAFGDGISMQINRNGSAFSFDSRVMGDQGSVVAFNFTGLFELTAGDVIEVTAASDTGNDFTLFGFGFSRAALTRIGPERWTG